LSECPPLLRAPYCLNAGVQVRRWLAAMHIGAGVIAIGVMAYNVMVALPPKQISKLTDIWVGWASNYLNVLD